MPTPETTASLETSIGTVNEKFSENSLSRTSYVYFVPRDRPPRGDQFMASATTGIALKTHGQHPRKRLFAIIPSRKSPSWSLECVASPCSRR